MNHPYCTVPEEQDQAPCNVCNGTGRVIYVDIPCRFCNTPNIKVNYVSPRFHEDDFIKCDDDGDWCNAEAVEFFRWPSGDRHQAPSSSWIQKIPKISKEEYIVLMIMES